jgi:hypothetical protein
MQFFTRKYARYAAVGIESTTSSLTHISSDHTTPKSHVSTLLKLYSFDFEISIWDPKQIQMTKFSTAKL